MLPSKIPLNQSDHTHTIVGIQDGGGDPPPPPPPPPRVSNGGHVTVTKRNRQAADKHQAARACRQDLQNYWESQG